MKIIRPVSIAGSALASSNAPEAAPATYSGATTYGLAAQVSVATGTVGAQDVYQSLQAGNLNHTPASSPTWWAYVGRTYLAWSGATTYGVGAVVIDAAAHRQYESLQAANTNHPLTDPLWWVDMGPTNRWAMFDQSNSTATEAQDTITVSINTTGRVDSVALLNISAATAQVVMTVAGDGVVYDETFALVSDSGVIDWYAYFFEPISRKADLIISGLPPYAAGALTVTLTDAGSTVSAGNLVVGLSKDLGPTAMGASIGIQDYSRKEQNAFGDFVLVERAYSKRGTFTFWTPRGFTDELQRLLAGYRAVPIVYVGSEEFGSTVLFGFYRDFSISIDYPTHSVCQLEIVGLT